MHDGDGNGDDLLVRNGPGEVEALTIIDARRNLAARLRAAGVDTASMDARLLVEGALGGLDAGADPLAIVDASALDTLRDYTQRRLAGEPVWRILGEREFWSLPFRLSPATLEPRPDSETIIEAALAAIGGRREEPLSILDLGTGTGCLLIALLSECPLARGVGVDISREACETAAANADRNGVGPRSVFRQGDWTAGVAGFFDLVVSNPPYIPAADIAGLDVAVREHDPLRALDGGADGLDAYRRLAAGVPGLLAPAGAVVLEIGAGQENDVTGLMGQAGLRHRGTRKDLGGHARALVFTG